MSDYETKVAIDNYVAQHGGPAVVSLAEDTHLFHFAENGDWKGEKVVLVNRNGHHFRIIRQENSAYWRFVKTWNSLLDYDDWMDPSLLRTDPEELINLCGVGPQSRAHTFEALSLLPKGLTQPRRKAVWRHHMLSVRFDMNANTFTLVAEDMAATFSGKLWESADAARWCLANLAPTLVSKATTIAPAVAAQELAELEGSDLWGMF